MRVSRQSRRPKSSGELQDGGEDRTRHRLGQVVERGELFGADLEVGLEAGVAGLDHHVLVADDELVGALDVELVGAAAQPAHRLVEGEVARLGRHVLEREVRDVERLQDAGHDDVGAELVGGLAALGEQVDQLLLHALQAVAAEQQGIGVELEVEAGELGRVVLVADLLDHLHRDRRRTEAAIDEEELLLGADPPDAGLDGAVLQHQVERLQIAQELPGEGAQRFRVQLFDVVFAHRRGLSLGMQTDASLAATARSRGPQKRSLVETRYWIFSIEGSPSSGKAMSRRMTLACEVRVEAIAQSGAGVAQPAEPAGLGRGAFEPGPADVAEHHRAEPEEVKELALAVPALLDRQEDAAITLLVAQRVAAQAVVATEQKLALGVEILRQVDAGADVERLIREVAPEIAQAEREEEADPAPRLEPAAERRRAGHDLAFGRPPGAAQGALVDEGVAVGAEALRRRIRAWPSPASRPPGPRDGRCGRSRAR